MQIKDLLPGVTHVRANRKYCSLFVTFSDPMKALDAFWQAEGLELNEGRVLVLYDRLKERPRNF